jgi:hypothetical protein
MNSLHSFLGKSRVDQATHDTLVRRTAAALVSNGIFDVRADLSEYAKPSKIYWERTGEGHVPDVTGGRYVIEVETATSLDLEHTRSQCALFSVFAREKGLSFIVVVPIGYKSRMEWQLVGWSISATVWEM